MAGPLDGVRVLDLTTNVMGPYASLQLGDLGADVWKIEPPAGDTIRNVGPARHPGMSANFLHLNRNKRSLALDLKNPAGIEALLRMISTADVLMHSMRPTAMARLGLTYESAKLRNPRIIYCGMYGFGQDGPYADRPAYDDLIQAGVGLPVLQSRKTGEPENVATPLADRAVGLAAGTAVTAALYRRSITGVGQEVQVPMFETFAQFVLGDHLYGYTFDPPIGDWGYARTMDPGRRPYPTSDGGYIAVNLYIDKHWNSFFAVSGHPELAADPRFTDIHSRAEHLGILYEFLSEVFPTKTTAQWMRLLTDADIPSIRMHTPATLLDDPHMKAVGFFVDEEHPSEGPVRTMGIPQRWSADAPELRYPAPRLGEHSLALLSEAGFDGAEIGELVDSGAVSAAEGAAR
ncbi:CoA transferase [Nocardia sp. CA2R105]|uniref:CaiB/BaiF CoA transferase family protein n=1 Tax=Nocardia coffeae TaxID=2873381 RepID=UPI001CA72015|nr:CoA transferase [Nocardia coffeae]MBY8856910.1 CoA transferase [Nocardia coffeae]